MDAVLGAPVPSPNNWFAVIGGTFCSLAWSNPNSLSSVVVSATIGAAVSYLTGFYSKSCLKSGTTDFS